MAAARADPTTQQAFICHLQARAAAAGRGAGWAPAAGGGGHAALLLLPPPAQSWMHRSAASFLPSLPASFAASLFPPPSAGALVHCAAGPRPGRCAAQTAAVLHRRCLLCLRSSCWYFSSGPGRSAGTCGSYHAPHHPRAPSVNLRATGAHCCPPRRPRAPLPAAPVVEPKLHLLCPRAPLHLLPLRLFGLASGGGVHGEAQGSGGGSPWGDAQRLALAGQEGHAC